jgi:hypothetical protein
MGICGNSRNHTITMMQLLLVEKESNCTFTRGFPATSSNDLALAIKRARVTAIRKAAIATSK